MTFPVTQKRGGIFAAPDAPSFTGDISQSMSRIQLTSTYRRIIFSDHSVIGRYSGSFAAAALSTKKVKLPE